MYEAGPTKTKGASKVRTTTPSLVPERDGDKRDKAGSSLQLRSSGGQTETGDFSAYEQRDPERNEESSRRDRERITNTSKTRKRLLSKIGSPHRERQDFRHDGPHHSHNEKVRILCVNNKHDPRLRDERRYKLGTSAQCISKGFGAALHQHIDDEREFVKRFDAPYEKIIDLDSILWYKNSDPPAGRHRATLPMAFQKGWGAGSAALAKKIKDRAGSR